MKRKDHGNEGEQPELPFNREVSNSPDMPAAQSLGKAGMNACADKAERVSDFDREAAKELVVQKLGEAGKPMSCEDLVDHCKEHGHHPHRDNAFGTVFRALSQEKRIEKAGNGPRRKGHAAPGATWWRLPA